VAQKKIISTRIRVARNLAMFPLNPGGTLQTRLDIATLMGKVFDQLQGEFSGELFMHSSMTDEQRKTLIADHFLFRGADTMQAASGYHEHWPLGRGIFHNKSKTFLLWINEGDHLRIISMEEGGDVVRVAQRLHEGIQAIEEGLKKVTGKEEVFMKDPILGCITCCPSNLGTGMRGSVHILVPKLIAKLGLDGIDKLCRERNCQARGSSGEHSKVVDRIDVSNWRRLGFPEYELVSDMITAANYLAQLEDEIPEGSQEAAVETEAKTGRTALDPDPEHCPGCSQTLGDGPTLTAIDRKWHTSCFACRDCKKPITGFIYAEFGGVPVCHACAKKLCTGCNEPLEGKPVTDAIKTGRWHKDCFKCRDCRKVITNYMFHEVGGTPLCIACSKKICVACKQPVEKGGVTSNERKWHAECFKCVDCKKVINNFIFLETGGQILCQYCTKKRGIAEGVDCFKCGKSISVDGVTDPVSNKLVHVHCLICSHCKQAVGGSGTCVQRGNLVLHKECADATRDASKAVSGSP
jgi:protein-arginine kinase